MSPIRPERQEDSGPSPALDDRTSSPPRSTPVSGFAGVQARLELLLSQCRRRGGVLAVVCVSVDAIAVGGGVVGAGAAQRVREEVSNRIGNAVRGSDSILRENDGDTCVVLTGADASVVERVLRRLERLVGGDYRVGDDLLQVTVRVGSAVHPRDGSRAAELLRRASRPD
jgi:GGDEF domain-containing protein